jgi:hypothetical protein
MSGGYCLNEKLLRKEENLMTSNVYTGQSEIRKITLGEGWTNLHKKFNPNKQVA